MGQVWQHRPNIGQTRPKVGQVGPNLAKRCSNLASAGNTLAKIDQVGANSAKCQSNMSQFGQSLVKLSPHWARLGRNLANRATFRQLLGDFSATVGQLWSSPGCARLPVQETLQLSQFRLIKPVMCLIRSECLPQAHVRTQPLAPLPPRAKVVTSTIAHVAAKTESSNTGNCGNLPMRRGAFDRARYVAQSCCLCVVSITSGIRITMFFGRSKHMQSSW